MLRCVSNGGIHPFSNFHGSVKTHCGVASKALTVGRALYGLHSALPLAIGLHLIGSVSTPNARIDINLKRKICRYNGFGAVSTAVGGQMTFSGRRRRRRRGGSPCNPQSRPSD